MAKDLTEDSEIKDSGIEESAIGDREGTGAWSLGIVMGLLALIGLYLASRAVDPIFYGTGLALAAFGVLFIFALIRQNTGR
jgi:hypothetical protein